MKLSDLLANLFDRRRLRKENVDKLKSTIEKTLKTQVHTSLTEQIIDSTPDNKLWQTVYFNLFLKIKSSSKSEYKVVAGWNRSRQSIFLIWVLDGQVNNGGFNQFYFNCTEPYPELLPGALAHVGAHPIADIMQAANNIYLAYKGKINKRQDGTLEGFSKSYEDNPLNELDQQYYDMNKTKNLDKLLISFIRNNKPDFID